MRDHLIEGFDYDLWANRAWLPVVERFPSPDEARAVLRHNVEAQRIWYLRCAGGTGDLDMPEDLGEAMEKFHRLWVDLIRDGDPGAYVSYERDGTTYHHTLEQIARHVLNHGTYHRGHLRGLCSALGIEEFPETDFVVWLRQTR